jgi:thiosulfate reductase cytochrome b subunit
MFFLVMSGLQIFNAHPILYLGHESGFEYDNSIFALGTPAEPLIPGWLTLPSGRDLATGRVVHFFFAWVFVAALLVWALGAVLTGHLIRDLLPRMRDLRGLARDIRAHLRLRFHHTRRYGPLQKLTYGGVLFGLFPLMILTGLAMSPGANTAWPWIPEMFGGRQTARMLHFVGMVGIVGFVVVHLAMIFLAGPLNELRAIITGYYRTDEGEQP